MLQHKSLTRQVFVASCLLFFSGCHSTTQQKIIITGEEYTNTEWSAEEQQQDIAARTLYKGIDSSSHLVRLNGREQPHYHDKHDLYVSILSGTSTIHFRNHKSELKPGSFIIIPRGTYHWAESNGNEACVLITIFSPAFDGIDKRVAD